MARSRALYHEHPDLLVLATHPLTGFEVTALVGATAAP
jgi:hypothetical protein